MITVNIREAKTQLSKLVDQGLDGFQYGFLQSDQPVVGSDGYGFATVDGVHHKVPQVGIVVLEDDADPASFEHH